MTQEQKSQIEELSLAHIDARHVMDVCGDAARTEKLVAWMDELVEENVTLMAALAEGWREWLRVARVCVSGRAAGSRLIGGGSDAGRWRVE